MLPRAPYTPGMSRTISIARRFNGPNNSGNGGYSAGLAAQLLPDAEAVEATLRAAIPLDQPLDVQATDAGFDITSGADDSRTLIMALRPTDLATPDVTSPGLAAASVAAATFRDINDHVLPHCFVCGPARAEGDGLRIFADWLKDPAGIENPNAFPLVAAPWHPSPDLADAAGLVAPEFMWAALDCPGAFAINAEPILLGRMSARILHRPRADQPVIVVAWAKGRDRRKHFAGSALFNPEGDLLAFSEQTWIQIDAHAPPKEL
jgi:hypothetical protein